MQKKVKMTKTEKDMLTQLALQQRGLDEVIQSQVRVGTNLSEFRESFWDGIYTRLGIPRSIIIRASSKDSMLSWDEDKEVQIASNS